MKPIILIALLLAASPVSAGYLTDSQGNIIRNGFGECWRTGYWTPAMAVAECDPGLVPTAAIEVASMPSRATGAFSSEIIPSTNIAPQAAPTFAAPPVETSAAAPRPYKTIIRKRTEINTNQRGEVISKKEVINDVIEVLPKEEKDRLARSEKILSLIAGLLGSIVAVYTAAGKIFTREKS